MDVLFILGLKCRFLGFLYLSWRPGSWGEVQDINNNYNPGHAFVIRYLKTILAGDAQLDLNLYTLT